MSSKPHYSKAGSMNIAEVGRKIRISQARLRDSDEPALTHSAWKVWSACSVLTASWSKGSDRVHVVTIANLAGLRPDKVSPILRKFDELGIFGWVKDEGKRSPGILSLPSLSEPDLSAPKPAKPKVPLCPNHPDAELWLNEHHSDDSAYVAKIVNGDGSAWCCRECTKAAWSSASTA